ncbi:MAG: wax ester/triacylglycerol synthase domain-containing protein [Ilumatobacteraceae bacterium]
MSGGERRMTDAESLMWRLEKDPYLASTFANITVLDRPPDMDRLVARMERTSLLFPRLRRKVQLMPANVGNPMWVDDPAFDIRHHVRRVALPEPGSMRQLQDLVTLLIADPFDRSRPLWQFIVVDGLEGGRSAMVLKLHHTITDGQGGVELSLHYLDMERDPAPLPPLDPEVLMAAADVREPDPGDALRGAMADTLRVPIAVLKQVRGILADPGLIAGIGSSTSATVRNVLAQLQDTDRARSPLWTERSLRRRLETARVPYKELRAVSKMLGGTLNTAFVTAAAHAAGRYHDLMGSPVESLRASMAISTRTDSSQSNAFSLARMLVTTSGMPITDRFAAVNEILLAARTSGTSGAVDAVATIATVLPTSVITRLARAQSQTVDFATSNVRGAGTPLYVAGSKLLGNYPVGPLAGTAFNMTLLSYMGSLDVGINIDEAAVENPDLLRESLDDAFAQLVALAPRTEQQGAGTPEPVETPRRWWKRLSRSR